MHLGRGGTPTKAKNIQVHVLGTKAVRTASSTATQVDLAVTAFNLKALPNPSASDFTLQVQSRSHERMQLRVTDVSGRTVQVIDHLSAGHTVKLSAAYRKGVYFVELSQGNNRQQIKLIKL